MSDWATITAAIITGLATIVAICIAWWLTKQGLYNYQQRQDLKKTEVRLLRNVFDTKTKITESILLMIAAIQRGDKISSVQEKKEEFFKFFNSVSGFDLLLEEIRTELSMTTPIYKNYKKEMGDSVIGILQFFSSPSRDDWFYKVNPYFDLLNSIFDKLIQFVHNKISAKLKKFEPKKR